MVSFAVLITLMMVLIGNAMSIEYWTSSDFNAALMRGNKNFVIASGYTDGLIARSVLKSVSTAFSKEIGDGSLLVAYVGSNSYCTRNTSCSEENSHVFNESFHGYMSVYAQRAVERTCILLPPSVDTLRAKHLQLVGIVNIDAQAAVDLINSLLNWHRKPSGQLSKLGIKRETIMNKLYRPLTSNTTKEKGKKAMWPQHVCDEVDGSTLSPQTFFTEYVARSKPLILRNVAAHWPAIPRWTNDFLQSLHSGRKVHVKVAPMQGDGMYADFEGVEPISWWRDSKDFEIPAKVRKQLVVDDLVVPRPASIDVSLEKFFDLLIKEKENVQSWRSRMGQNNSTLLLYEIRAPASFYIEYSSIPFHNPELLKDIEFLPVATFLQDKEKHMNLWLSNGRTTGKLHMDPYENLLVQIAEEKHLLLIPPFNNTRLYEGHIIEAEYDYSLQSKVFHRHRLRTSTAMVMSPIDITNPDLSRFPLFEDARDETIACTIRPGDALFLPSWWWHEVKSTPDEQYTAPRNIAVNFWYSPLFEKPFPCAECNLTLGHDYNDIITKWININNGDN